jgi:hypothetical protein
MRAAWPSDLEGFVVVITAHFAARHRHASPLYQMCAGASVVQAPKPPLT